MKKYILILPIFILTALVVSACGASVERTLDYGNQAFSDGDYQQAMEKYAQAMEMSPELSEPSYNLANALYRLEAFEEAGQFLAHTIQTASGQLAEHGFYNLGNSFFQQELMPEAVESYKEALRLDTQDMDAKYNLELAMVQQEQQQEQQEQDQQSEDEQESGQDQQDQSEQGQEEQDQSPSDQSDNESDQSQDQQDQSREGEQDQEQQDQDQNGQPQENQDGQGQPQQVEGLTEEQARQLLAAIGQSSETLQEKMDEIFGVGGMPPDKDW